MPEHEAAPDAVLPFELDQEGVDTALRHWVSSRWFAPSSLKKVTRAESPRGTYLPHWIFAARAESDYEGRRGDHYWETETYTETIDGVQQTRTRQVSRTRWRSASGTVWREFEDVLVAATLRLTPEQLDRLKPWPLEHLVPYEPERLEGRDLLGTDLDPEEGFERAKTVMAKEIEQDCRRDIGGDEQRVGTVETRYSDVTHRLVLLPVWIASYLHDGRSWQLLVNGRTGEVLGDRPYSTVKISIAVAAGLAALASLIFLIMGDHPG
ncbi:hypothetical protein [Sphaerisporangium fuscum]|uniref:hypothetical protein n=1 Tax=Sphaerisporangium fuscum TaxID=2835868 RepID=UPI001BDCB697|nr:hypothetical protein [Sphaerisporangium fuscum]